MYSFGGLASYDSGRRDRRSQILVLLAGPGAGFLFAAVVIGIVVATNHSIGFFDVRFGDGEQIFNPRARQLVYELLWINIAWGIVNLFPVIPLDGGQIAREILTGLNPWQGPRQALWLSVLAGGFLAIAGLQFFGSLYVALFFGYMAYTSYMALQGPWPLEWSLVIVPDMSAAPHSPSIPNRVVILGASNVTRGLASVLDAARLAWGRPLQAIAAIGMGRSYGMASRVLGRTLSGIAECGLWPALSRAEPAPTAALVTDVGNDLLYDASPATIAAWVETCIERLRAVDARIVLTRLPLANLEHLSRAKFYRARAILFPGSRVTFDQVRGRALELDERLNVLARRHHLSTVAPRTAWYGFDPIHVTWRAIPVAWREYVAPWAAESADNRRDHVVAAANAFMRSCLLRRLAPNNALFGAGGRAEQPCCRLRDGTTIALY